VDEVEGVVGERPADGVGDDEVGAVGGARQIGGNADEVA